MEAEKQEDTPASAEEGEVAMLKRHANASASWLVKSGMEFITNAKDYIIDAAEGVCAEQITVVEKRLDQMEKEQERWMNTMEDRLFQIEVALSKKRERSESGDEDSSPPQKKPRLDTEPEKTILNSQV